MSFYTYSRCSTERQSTDGVSLEVQERQLAGWATMKDVTFAESFPDAGVSGSIPVGERPAGTRLLATVKRGDAIVSCRLDRLFRNALDALQTVETLRQRGVALYLLDLGNDDVCSNGIAKMFLTVAAAFAEGERDRIRERVQKSKDHGKANGEYLGGHVPFGFVVNAATGALEPVAEQQAIIQQAKAMRAAGATLQAIRNALPKRSGVALALTTIARMVKE